jgi:hypothetical protein
MFNVVLVITIVASGLTLILRCAFELAGWEQPRDPFGLGQRTSVLFDVALFVALYSVWIVRTT